MSRVDDCIGAVQRAVQRGAGTEEVLDEIAIGLGEQLKPFTFIAVLHGALEVPLLTLRDLEGWERAHEHGDMTTAEVVSVLRFWVEGPPV
jgi:hypothetical protein